MVQYKHRITEVHMPDYEAAIAALQAIILHSRTSSEDIAKIERMIWQLRQMMN